MLTKIRNYRNQIDFSLRQLIRFSRPLPDNYQASTHDQIVQTEVLELLEKFSWSRFLPRKETLVAADIGAKNFALAPALDRLFANLERKAVLHGIEIDAYRRLRDFRSRRDYGIYYAGAVRQGYYHAMDFFNWEEPLDVAFLLNPFLSENPLLAWGLPLSQLKPHALFGKIEDCLNEGGVLFLTCPSSDEFAIGSGLARRAGLQLKEEGHWSPSAHSVQKKPRWAGLFTR